MVVLVLTTTADARDQASLNDLAVRADRIPDFYPNDAADTSDWSVFDVTNAANASSLGCPRAIASDGGDDGPALACFSNNSPARSVLYLPPGDYDCDSMNGTNTCFHLSHTELVLRGAGQGITTIRSSRPTNIITVNNGGATGASNGWTGGYARGSRVLTVTGTSGLVPGGWVMLRANPDSQIDTDVDLTYYVRLSCVAGAGSDCSGVATNQIRIDRPLRTDFDTGGQSIRVWRPYEHVGLESLTLEYDNPAGASAYSSGVWLIGTADSWVQDVQFKNGFDTLLYVMESARGFVRGSRFDELHKPGQWNKSAARIQHGVHDFHFENNSTHHTPVAIQISIGASGLVVGYNRFFAPQDASLPANWCERSIFFHSGGVWDVLVEGNDFSCGVSWDTLWGGPGHRIIWYRNRGRDEGVQAPFTGGSPGTMTFHYDGLLQWTDTVIRDMTFVGNAVLALGATPPPGVIGANLLSEGMWYERNLFRDSCELQQDNGPITSDCIARNTPPGDLAHNYSDTTWRDNVVGSARAPGSWSGFAWPDSLYQAGVPSWWCQESGTFPSIGAPSDDFANPASHTLLPAHRTSTGMACSAVGGFPTPTFLPE
ncbi:MAG: hypothetical protein CL908_12410 [Deltaproteobacteria bacterium]|nr:hypothetical protein [Deltaproteobacteria bacterium]